LRKHVARQGGDPTAIADVPFRMMRPKETATFFGLSEATLWRMIQSGTFPRPIAIDRASMR
jgi:predicted DNA-binding transcriptional regulator AlpA